MPRCFYEMYVGRKRALEMSDPSSETSNGGQNHPKTALSLRCRGDVSGEPARGEVLLQLQLRPACRKYPGMCRAREGQGRDGSTHWEDVGQDCACPPTTGSQPAPTPHLEKHRANTAGCRKGVEEGLALW